MALREGGPAVEGRSIAQLARGEPLFPPIDGLPAEVWQGRQCSGCHNWDRATLCAQGEFYTVGGGTENLRKAHPFGGGFKAQLRRWAVQGCN